VRTRTCKRRQFCAANLDRSPIITETDVQQSKDWLEMCLGRENTYNFSVELLGSEKEATESDPEPKRRVIGVVGAIRTPEIGYMVHPDYWGTGITTEAMRAFMPLFWEHTEGRFDYCFALVDPDHTPSRKVLEKLGFSVHEYREKDFESPHLGIRDTVVYRIMRPGISAENAKGPELISK
jgi:RimJ/RimL family protein N-acetyltransferase